MKKDRIVQIWGDDNQVYGLSESGNLYTLESEHLEYVWSMFCKSPKIEPEFKIKK